MRVEAAMLERSTLDGCVWIVAHTVLHTVRDGMGGVVHLHPEARCWYLHNVF